MIGKCFKEIRFVRLMNYNIDAAWHYHNGTKHPHGKLHSSAYFYDPAVRPTPYKIYTENLQSINLPLEKKPVGKGTFAAVSDNIKQDEKTIVPDLNTLARILYFSNGITKTIHFPRLGDMEFRAAACTGALYHIEIYVVCGDITGLGAGVYHFDPKEMNLKQLRRGDYRHVLIGASGNDVNVEHAPVILVYTDIFTRNSIKYQTREYRHGFWDCGVILANTLALSSTHDLPAKVIVGFVDEAVNFLLDLNTQKEVSLALVPIGFTKKTPTEKIQVQKLNLATEPLSSYTVDDPEIQAIHQASSLATEKEVIEWKEKAIKTTPLGPTKNDVPLDFQVEKEILQNPIESVIIKRGSTREFSRQSISFQQLSAIIYYSTRWVPADFLRQEYSLVDLYLIVNSVDGLDSGSYYYNKEQNSLQLLKAGNLRSAAGHLGLDQSLPADGSVCVFFLSDLNEVLDKFGNRGYRASELEASTIGGRLYLTSYAQGLGATGLTFYDDEVTQFFSPHAKNKSVMFLVAIGKKARISNT